MLADPSAPPLQVTSVCVVVAVKAVGSATVADAVVVQLLASVTVTL